jgi:sulfonate transport system substrate-binding protein
MPVPPGFVLGRSAATAAGQKVLVMMSHRETRVLLAVAALLLPAAACGGSDDSDGLRLGYQETTWGAPLILANDIDAWQDTGLEVDPMALSSGNDIRDGVIAGSLDAGSMGATTFTVSASKGEAVAVAVLAYAGETDAIVVPNDSSIESVEDLDGMKVGSQEGSTTNEIFVSKILPAHGLSEGDIEPVNMKFQDMYSAMVSGQIDAFAGVDPYPTLAEHNDEGRVVTTFDEYDPTPLYLVVSKEMADENPGQVVDLVEGWLRTVEQWKSDPEGTVETVSNVFAEAGTSLDTEVVEESLAHLNVTPDFLPDTEQYLTELAQSLQSQGAIDELPDWSESIDTSFLEKAKKNMEGEQ